LDCDICGRPAITAAFVEGARLNVCQNCLKLGKQAIDLRTNRAGPAPVPLKELEPVEGYGAKAATARKSKGYSTLELAHKLNITESVIKQLEAQTRFCGEETAHKLERELGIVLVKPVEATGAVEQAAAPVAARSGRGSFTLADVATLKRTGAKD
jgi:uncharacterized protein (TIGR00270 family)